MMNPAWPERTLFGRDSAGLYARVSTGNQQNLPMPSRAMREYVGLVWPTPGGKTRR
jgi:hypothetical protein